MQAIVTKFYGPTNHRGSRIKATADSGSVWFSYDHSLSTEDNHRAAAETLLAKLDWSGQLAQGYMPGGGYAFVFVGA